MAGNEELSKWVISIEGDIRDLKRSLGQVESTTKSHTRSVKQGLATVKASWLAVAGATYAVVRAVQNVGREFAQFEHKMREVNTLIGMGKGNFDAYKKSVLAVTREVPQSARELSAALYDIVSAGVAVKDSAKILELSGKAAVAGVTDTKTAARAGIAVVNAYGMSMDELSSVYDTLFQTVRMGVTTFPELAGSIGQVLPIARSAGVSFEEVAAAIATMTKSGINTAEATTYLRNSIMKLRAPTGAAAEGAKKLGIEWKGLIPTLREINRRGINIDQMKMLIPDLRAAQGVLALSQNIDTLNESMESIGELSGSFEDAYEIMEDSPINKMKMLGNAISELKIALADTFAPTVTATIDASRKAIYAWMDAWERLGSLAGGIPIAELRLRTLVNQLEKEKDLNQLFNERSALLKEISRVEENIQKRREQGLTDEDLQKVTQHLISLRRQEQYVLAAMQELAPSGGGGGTEAPPPPEPMPGATTGTGADKTKERFEKGYAAYQDYMDKVLAETNKRIKYEDSVEKKAMDDWIAAKKRANELVGRSRLELMEMTGQAEQAELERAKQKHEQNVEILVAAHESAVEEEERYQVERTKIQKKYADRRTAIEQQSITETFRAMQVGTSHMAELFSTLYELSGRKSIELFNLMKAAAVAEIAVNTAAAIMRLHRELPYPAAVALTPIVAALGAAKTAQVISQEPPKMAEGGLLKGRKHSQGGIPVEAEDNEFIEPSQSVNYYGKHVFEALRRRQIPRNIFQGIPMLSARTPSLSFAEGGLVSGRERVPGSESHQEVNIANYIDENLFDRFMATRRGQDAIVNVISENNTMVKRILNEV